MPLNVILNEVSNANEETWLLASGQVRVLDTRTRYRMAAAAKRSFYVS